MSPVQCGCVAGLTTFAAIALVPRLCSSERAEQLLVWSIQVLRVLLVAFLALGALGVFG